MKTESEHLQIIIENSEVENKTEQWKWKPELEIEHWKVEHLN